MGIIYLHKSQEKIFLVTKKQKYKSKKAHGTFGDSELTSSAGVKVSFKNIRGSKARKAD